MGEKQIDLTKSVYELCNEFPELPEILATIGFTDIIKPGILSTMGRFMTIPKGAIAKKIDLYLIIQTLRDHGYVVL
ncbi:MAG: hypothetical protein K0S01_917 [Herbinix sp.]|jgi:hypothetical protein|nr:hypothetical protein [Herbinix sp.]